jgi:hypothetical protein
MIIRRIVLVGSLANQPDQKISIDAFVVMQWYEVQIVQAKAGSDQEDNDHTDSPGVPGETLLARRCYLLATRDCYRLFGACFFFAT